MDRFGIFQVDFFQKWMSHDRSGPAVAFPLLETGSTEPSTLPRKRHCWSQGLGYQVADTQHTLEIIFYRCKCSFGKSVVDLDDMWSTNSPNAKFSSLQLVGVAAWMPDLSNHLNRKKFQIKTKEQFRKRCRKDDINLFKRLASSPATSCLDFPAAGTRSARPIFASRTRRESTK